MLSSTDGEAALSEKTCRKWFQRFKSGDFIVKEQHRGEKENEFERPLRGMNVNIKASRTYRLLADICQTYSSCILFSTRKNEFENYSDDAEGLWE